MSTEAFSRAAFPRLTGPVTAEREQARVRGYAEGHAEGFRAGMADAADRHAREDAERHARESASARALDDAVAALRAATRSASERARELTAAGEERVIAHAIDLAEVILAAELADPGASAAASVRRVLDAVDGQAVREIRVHPDDLATLVRNGAETGTPPLVADPDLLRGDAVAVLEHGIIDARIGAAIQRARRAMTEGAP